MTFGLWDNETINTYLEGNCHLLTFYLWKKLPGSEIYILNEETKRKSLLQLHSLVFMKNKFYDINGSYDSEEEFIDGWKEQFYMEGCNLALDKTEFPESFSDWCRVDYSHSEHLQAKEFVEKHYIPMFIKN